jgi:hypothetical protein
MTYILNRDVSDDGYTDANLMDAKKLVGIRLCCGDSLVDRFPSGIRVVIDSPNEPNDFFVAGPMPIISEQTKQVLMQFSANVEYLHVDLSMHDGSKPKKSYYYPNILDVIDCLDWKASRYTKESKYATKIRSIVLHENNSNESPIFLIERTIPYLICVQKEVGNALVEAGCKGIVFVSDSDWKNPAYPA